MSRILVLGGGRQGCVMARDLGDDHDVTVADSRALELGGSDRVTAVQADLSDTTRVAELAREHDLVIGALPSWLGFAAARACLEAGRDMVDIAFFPEDAGELDAVAREHGVRLLPDCGIAPGLSHLVAGRACAAASAAGRSIETLRILVGGVAADPSRPYGYVVSWSLEDLVEEYTRPARIRQRGETVTVPAMSGLETIEVPGIGPMEAFYSDGLRTLLDMTEIRTIEEKTLRHPGHIAAIQPLLESETLVEEFGQKCLEGDDVVVLMVEAEGPDGVTRARLDVPARDGLSGMARATALPCAAFARRVLAGDVTATGLVRPEDIGRDAAVTDRLLADLEPRGLRFDPPRPFTAG